MGEIKFIVKYLKLMLLNWTLTIILFLDFAGILTTYFSEYHIPSWILYSFPIAGIIYSGYSIFKKSSPKITVQVPDSDDIEVIYEGHERFALVMKSHLTNFGIQSGSLEFIKVSSTGINGIKDPFVLKKIGFNCNELIICDKKPNIYLIPLKKNEYIFKFPQIIEQDKMSYFYIVAHFSMPWFTKDDNAEETLQWVKEINFEISYKTKDSFGTEQKRITFSVSADAFSSTRKESIQDWDEFSKMIEQKREKTTKEI
jgi:hypothetical protein